MTDEGGTRWIALAGATSLHLAVGLALFFAMSSGVPIRGRSVSESGRPVVVNLVPFERPGDLDSRRKTEGDGVGAERTARSAEAEPHGGISTVAAVRATGESETLTASDASQTSVSSATANLPTAEVLAYRARLQAHLARYRTYPADARAGRQQGVVVLNLYMDRDGHVIDVWVQESSGVSSIDIEALAAATRAQPLPPFPTGWPERMTITIPVLFRLS